MAAILRFQSKNIKAVNTALLHNAVKLSSSASTNGNNSLRSSAAINSDNNINNIYSAALNHNAESTALKTASRGATIQSIAAERNAVMLQKSDTIQSISSESAQSKYGQALDWWKSAQYVFPRGAVAVVTDLYTGKSFKVKRTFGTNHADCEALTIDDTNIIKSIWGGFSWDRRPVVVNVNGERIAASMSGMPHAGIDSKPALAYIKNRSGGFGSGENLDAVKGNGMDGHFDIHFLNSTRHKDGEKDPQHQDMVLKASGR